MPTRTQRLHDLHRMAQRRHALANQFQPKETSNVDDNAFCEELAAKYTSGSEPHQKKMANAVQGKLADALKAIVAKFKAMGLAVPWGKVIALIGQIVVMITTGGGDWSAIIAAILALFFPPTPAPVPA